MIKIECPKCNKVLMVYDSNFVFEDELLVKSLCCDEHFYISYEYDDEFCGEFTGEK